MGLSRQAKLLKKERNKQTVEEDEPKAAANGC